MNAKDILIRYWGYTQFRLKQELVINEILAGKDTLALLPTGGGKSLCYQIPGIYNDGICLVITPLIALMYDQVQHLKSKGVKSNYITGEMSFQEIDTILLNCIYGKVKFLYLSPEKLQNKQILDKIAKMNINLIAVDEAHCISEWGNDFRPAYRKINSLRNLLPTIPILALTATATEEVVEDIQNNLLFQKHNLIKSSFKRDNISYVVDNTYNKKEKLIQLIQKIRSSVIVYVGSRKQAENITKYLISHKFSAISYHAGMSSKTRKEKQKSWQKDEKRIIVATSAFGMGVNKKNVKLVVHMHLPSNIETYFQEAGRAGRDGKNAYAFLLANKNDITIQKELIDLKYPSIKEIIDYYQNIANYLQIAIGDHPQEPIPFNLEKFIKRYNYSKLKNYNILNYLEKEGLLKVSNSSSSYSKILFNISRSELYKFQIANRYYDKLIKFLLRKYGNIFFELTPINEISIAEKNNLDLNELIRIFNKLEQLNIIKYQKANNLPNLIFLNTRIDLSKNSINTDKRKKRKEYDLKKLEFISDYIINTSICRSKFLLDYFSENEIQECNICDICVIKKRNTINESEYVVMKDKIKNLILNNELTFVEISEKLSEFYKKDLINTLAYLFDNDKIVKFGNKYKWKR